MAYPFGDFLTKFFITCGQVHRLLGIKTCANSLKGFQSRVLHGNGGVGHKMTILTEFKNKNASHGHIPWAIF